MQLVADANVLLSAVIGGRAALVLKHEQVEQVFTPTAAYDEVFEYLAPLTETAMSLPATRHGIGFLLRSGKRFSGQMALLASSNAFAEPSICT